VLLFFAGLFVVSGTRPWRRRLGASHVPVFGAIHGTAADYVRLAAVFLVGSNVVPTCRSSSVIRPEMRTC
jgi:hypothetical protein